MTYSSSVSSSGLLGRLFGALIIFAFGALFISTSGNADDSTTLVGNHPFEAETFRQIGEAKPNLNLQMGIHFASRNQAALDKLLAQQQNRASSNYHRWLSADDFRDRFGVTAKEVDAVAAWLVSQGFTVASRGGNSLAFSGPVSQVQRAFAVRIATFGDGSVYANTSDPSIPRRFANVIAAVTGLDNMMHAVSMAHRSTESLASSGPVRARELAPSQLPFQLAMADSHAAGPDPNTIINGAEAFGPADVRSFYDESVGDGADGSGSCIAIVGVSDFLDSTMTTFARQFGLPAPSYTRVLHGSNPGINAAEAESELDLQW